MNFGSIHGVPPRRFHLARRVAQGRADNGAKLVTFDVRLSNTAGRSDEWHAPFPGTDGLIALAMARSFSKPACITPSSSSWVNADLTELREFYAPYTPERAQQESGIKAADIRPYGPGAGKRHHRRGLYQSRQQAHYNGFNNDRAVILLNALVGSIGQEGGSTA